MLDAISGAARAGVAALCLVSAAKAEEAARPQVQYGTDFLSVSALEYPFIDRVKGSSGYWAAQTGARTGDLIEGGHIDSDTGLPVSMPAGAGSLTVGYWMVGADAYPDYFAGDYIVEWDGNVSVEIFDMPRDRKRADGNSRLIFNQAAGDIKRIYLGLKDLADGGLSRFHIYRAEHEEAFKSGALWSPDFLDFASGWDVIRTMDWQSTNNSPVRSWDDLATLESAHWGTGHRSQWPPAPYYSMPYEALFDLGVKSGAAMWVHVPVEIGSPKHHSHPDFAKDGKSPADRAYEDAHKFRAFARANAKSILASPEWDRYAENFLIALEASGYPAERPLYVEVGNEIWNYAAGFIFSSWYAWAIAEGLTDEGILEKAPDASYGSGVLNARWQIALEAAQKRRNTNFNIVYVAASHTGLTARTTWMLSAQQQYYDHAGVDAAQMFAKTKVAAANYWGSGNAMGRDIIGDYRKDKAGLVAAWEARINANRAGAIATLRDFFLSERADSGIGSVGWIRRKWKDHESRAAAFGVDFLGAYEGGPSMEVQGYAAPLRQSEAFMSVWREFVWGPEGEKVTRSVNDALADAFPGVLLSKFQMVGAIGNPDDPWSAGHYSDKTRQWTVWEEYQRAVR